MEFLWPNGRITICGRNARRPFCFGSSSDRGRTGIRLDVTNVFTPVAINLLLRRNLFSLIDWDGLLALGEDWINWFFWIYDFFGEFLFLIQI